MGYQLIYLSYVMILLRILNITGFIRNLGFQAIPYGEKILEINFAT
ncbi:MAG: hypothetical protein R2852_02145 [Bacteroidia bacterium]